MSRHGSMTLEEYNKIIYILKKDASPQGLFDYALFRFGITSGLRAAELCGLTWGMISEGEEAIKATFIGKGSKRRTVQIEPEALAACKRAFRSRWGRAPKPSDYVFNAAATGRTANRPGIVKSSVHRHLKAIIKMAVETGILKQDFTFSTNSMRNVCINLLIAKNIQPPLVSKMLGISPYQMAKFVNDDNRAREIKLLHYRNHRECNKNRINTYLREYHKREKSKEAVRKRMKEKRKTNIQFNMGLRLRSRLRGAIERSGMKKQNKTYDLIGCSVYECMKYLESKFSDGMSWDNRSSWHIDHIRPCASFDLTNPEQQKQCFHYTNLQPLWAVDNMKKGAKLDCAPGGGK